MGMMISDLEVILGVTITGTPQEARYTALLPAAVAHVNKQCGNRFTGVDNVTVTLPPDVQVGVALVVKAAMENQNVSAQSLGDMSQSFFQGGTYKQAKSFWSQYRRAGFV